MIWAGSIRRTGMPCPTLAHHLPAASFIQSTSTGSPVIPTPPVRCLHVPTLAQGRSQTGSRIVSIAPFSFTRVTSSREEKHLARYSLAAAVMVALLVYGMIRFPNGIHECLGLGYCGKEGQHRSFTLPGLSACSWHGRWEFIAYMLPLDHAEPIPTNGDLKTSGVCIRAPLGPL